jgi:hypothetical protein
MRTFLDLMKEWDSVDPASERRSKEGLNMTASVPSGASISSLTRGFHLNTLVGRMMSPWVNTLEMPHWQSSLPPRFQEQGKMNKNFLAAYDLFKNEIAKAVHGVPVRLGRDVRTGEVVDVLGGAKEFLRGYDGEGDDYLIHLDRALKIQMAVFPRLPSLIRNFVNFLEITRDEFMTFKEVLPTLGEKSPEVIKKEKKRINARIAQYEAMEDQIKYVYD